MTITSAHGLCAREEGGEIEGGGGSVTIEPVRGLMHEGGPLPASQGRS